MPAFVHEAAGLVVFALAAALVALLARRLEIRACAG